MLNLRKHTITLGAVAVIAGVLAGASVQAAPTTHPATEPHPAIMAALKNLRQAKKDLERGAHDFGGHRVAALNDTDAAIAECEQALKFDK